MRLRELMKCVDRLGLTPVNKPRRRDRNTSAARHDHAFRHDSRRGIDVRHRGVAAQKR